MKKKIAILGSTGSIGKSTVSIIKKNKKDFKVVLLSTNRNLTEITKQIKLLKPKNLIITDYKKYLEFSKKNRDNKVKIFNDFKSLDKIFKNKIDYTMSAISSFNGLQPTLDIIKFTKVIAIANKEAIICGWNLIKKNLMKFKTTFIPVDSEHFSIWSLIKNNPNGIEKIYITASGGPFLNTKKNFFSKITPQDATKHPKWNMGKKISIDSATLVNKIFEMIEAKKIFSLRMNDCKILLHPDSYVHAIVKFKNGLTKILVHDTDMKIPIFNSIYNDTSKTLKSKSLNFKKINNLKLTNVNAKQFKIINIIKHLPNNKDTLYETVLVSANDQLVDLFLSKKIKFLDISKKLIMIMKLKEFKKLRSRKPLNFKQISDLNKYVRLKTRTLCVRSDHNA